jgi:hypothetical protein
VCVCLCGLRLEPGDGVVWVNADLGWCPSSVGSVSPALSTLLCPRHLPARPRMAASVLIAEYAPTVSARVLDLACGKLADWAKWDLKGMTHYVGVDVSIGQLRAVSVRASACCVSVSPLMECGSCPASCVCLVCVAPRGLWGAGFGRSPLCRAI